MYDDAAWDLWVAGADLAHDSKRGIVFGVRAEENFEVRVVLPKKAFDVFSELRFKSVNGLDDGDARQFRIMREPVKPPLGVSEKFRHTHQHQSKIDGGTQCSHERDRKKNVTDNFQWQSPAK